MKKSAQLLNDPTFKEKEEEKYSTRAQVCNKEVNKEIWAENAISSELFLRHKFFLKRNQAAAVQIRHVLQTGIMTKCKILSDFNLTLFIAHMN